MISGHYSPPTIEPHNPRLAIVDFGDEEEDEDGSVARRGKMKCLSSKEEYRAHDVDTYMECYEEASETKEELKLEIEDLKAKVNFLRLLSTGSGGTITILGLIH
ncbi:unnamed protein product [Fraxinus pennsylvanica]|uniref:Uncharacterized protein n=1 Tax=Fraxinus pennsylvanica TaxID=56036 RepID=A0AAD1ZHR5_9LAMI|nr:unnamed protein product [Fraxinus pennsylvanica]